MSDNIDIIITLSDLMINPKKQNKSKKIKIGIDLRDLRVAKTGARTYLEEISREFRKKDERFDFVFFDTVVPVYTGKNKWLKLIEHFRFFFWKQIQLPTIAFIRNCNIVFCTDYFVPYFHPGFVTIPVFHDAFFWEYPAHYNKYWLRMFHTLGIAAAKRSPYIVTVTKFAKKQIAFYSGIAGEKIIPIYEAPKSLNDGEQNKHGSLPVITKNISSQYLLHVGTFEKRKNLSILIEAFDEVLKNGFPDLKLILIGQASPKKDMDDSVTIKHLIEEKQLQDKVLVAGFVNNAELSIYYQNASVYVFPSINEGFGLPVLEAFAYGVPVMIANNSCLPEIAGDAAITFNPFDKEELFEKMKQLLYDKALQEQLIIKGKLQLQSFSWQNTAEELKALFERAYSKK